MDSRGFSLIELLIVVSIIGVLAAIAIPTYTKYRVKIRNTVARADLHSMQNVLEGFYSEHYHYPSGS